jgi:hypothetical protein
MATGYKTPGSGRKKGTPNKLSSRSVKRLAEQLVQQQQLAERQQLEGALQQPLTPLEYCLQAMRDESNPPGFPRMREGGDGLRPCQEGRRAL